MHRDRGTFGGYDGVRFSAVVGDFGVKASELDLERLELCIRRRVDAEAQVDVDDEAAHNAVRKRHVHDVIADFQRVGGIRLGRGAVSLGEHELLFERCKAGHPYGLLGIASEFALARAPPMTCLILQAAGLDFAIAVRGALDLDVSHLETGRLLS